MGTVTSVITWNDVQAWPRIQQTTYIDRLYLQWDKEEVTQRKHKEQKTSCFDIITRKQLEFDYPIMHR